MKPTFITSMMLICLCTTLFAQKTSTELKNSLRAPANVKIDGNPDEWAGKPQTYSRHTQFYYTISNDDKYLYLTIRAEYEEIVNRILKGGISLIINKSDKRKDPNRIQITYPLLQSFMVWRRNAPKVESVSAATVARLDSFVNNINAELESKAKLIKVMGIKNVDTLISVYNLDGIKAAGLLDNKLHYNYELAVSLAELALDINNPKKFMYQVIINEVEDKTPHGTLKAASGGQISFTISSPKLSGQPATDFWGEYTLAK